MKWRRCLASLLLVPCFAYAEPAIVFDCTGSTDRRQECSLSIDRERIEKAFEPIEAQAQKVNSPSEAMQMMANAMSVFASLMGSGGK